MAIHEKFMFILLFSKQLKTNLRWLTQHITLTLMNATYQLLNSFINEKLAEIKLDGLHSIFHFSILEVLQII